MRVIKFRGYEDGYGWVYGALVERTIPVIDFQTMKEKGHRKQTCIYNQDGGFIVGKAWIEVDPNTVGEYTGLKDRNGREIYEGDVVELRPRYSQPHRIEYCCGQWICVDAGGGCVMLIDDEQIGGETNDVEVIGNIHDNPELMK